MTELEELLEPYKKYQDASVLFVLTDNLPAMKILSMWTYITIEWEPEGDDIPEDEKSRLAWIWNGVLDSIDYHTLSAGSGVSLPKTVDLVNLLATMRLIYPDGTISVNAEAFLSVRTPDREITQPDMLREDEDE